MKHIWIVLASMFLFLPAIALGEDYGWEDGTYVIGDTGYVLTLPEGVLPVEPEGSVLVLAKTEGFNGKNGVTIGVQMIEDSTVDALLEEVYQQQITLSKKNKVGVIEAASDDSRNKLLMYQTSGNPCGYLAKWQVPVGEEKLPCCYEEIYTRASGSSMASLTITLFLPMEKDVYVVTYALAGDYVDGVENVILGTVSPM